MESKNKVPGNYEVLAIQQAGKKKLAVEGTNPHVEAFIKACRDIANKLNQQ